MAKSKHKNKHKHIGQTLGVSALILLTGAIIGFGVSCIPAVDDAISIGSSQIEQSEEVNNSTDINVNNYT